MNTTLFKECETIILSLEEESNRAITSITNILNRELPNLTWWIDYNGNISAWVKVKELAREGINLKHLGTIFQLNDKKIEILKELNMRVLPIVKEPDKFFWCTECSQVKLREELEETVFAGYYCKECAKKEDISNLIKMSHERGFYD